MTIDTQKTAADIDLLQRTLLPQSAALATIRDLVAVIQVMGEALRDAKGDVDTLALAAPLMNVKGEA